MTIADVALRLLAAAAAGALLGLERELRDKAAGLRTVTLVALGCALFTIAAEALAEGQTVRMAAGIAAGIGFLGAGSILRDRGEVFGLTTAASIWAAAALGVCAGAGLFAITATALAVTLLLLQGLRGVRLNAVREVSMLYEIGTARGRGAGSIPPRLPFGEHDLSATFEGVRLEPGRITATWLVRGRQSEHDAMMAALSRMDEVLGFETRQSG